MLYIAIAVFVFTIIAAVIIIPVLGGGFGKITPKGKREFGNATTLDKKFVQDKWAEIELLMMQGGNSQLKTAIMEADKLVDYALKSRGVAGDTMGDRLKNSKPKFNDCSDYDNLWFAHKVRNNIAHESTHELGSAEAKRAIEYFKKTLKILEAL